MVTLTGVGHLPVIARTLDCSATLRGPFESCRSVGLACPVVLPREREFVSDRNQPDPVNN